MAKKFYTISLEGIGCQEGENPVDAAKNFVNSLKTLDLHGLIYSVEDEETGQKYSVDLSEEDEDLSVSLI